MKYLRGLDWKGLKHLIFASYDLYKNVISCHGLFRSQALNLKVHFFIS